ncbi:LptF/LptG family permease [candidate division KSB1 bacterium]|nr:LptF/LptG family permease [candidate division KSB1 bacterium]
MLLDRYILKEHIAPFFYGLVIISLIFILNFAFQILGKIIGKGLNPSVIAEYFFLNLAWILALAIPMAVLVATLMAFGRLASEGEITAFKASGISLFRLTVAPFAAALIVTGLVVGFNNSVLPNFNHRARLLGADIRRKKPTLSIEPGVFVLDIPNYVLLAKKVDPKSSRLWDVTIYDESDPKTQTTLTAEEGSLVFSKTDGVFIFTLEYGEIHRINKKNKRSYQKTRFGRTAIRIQVPGMLLKRRESSYRGDREQSARMLLKKVGALKKDPQKNRRRINMLMVEVHKKYSIPFACLIFVLIGAPLGVRVRRSGMGVSGGLSILFFLIYWIALGAGEDLADRNRLSPFWAMWAPNVLVGVLGLYLFLRTSLGRPLLKKKKVNK